MIDFHTHILPALDDGAITVDDSIAMAKALASFGYTTVCCTPHCIKGYYDLTSQQVREATLMLQADLDNEGVDLELWPGMEYMLDEYFSEFAEDLLPLGSTKLVLCEAPPQAHPGFVQEGVEIIVSKGYVPLVAHPERTPYFFERILARGPWNGECGKDFTTTTLHESRTSIQGFLKKMFKRKNHEPRTTSHEPLQPSSNESESVLYHANLGSFTGFYGQKVQRNAYELLKLGAYTALASDLHESRTAADVLVQDKFDNNPFLKQLADFDGSTNIPQALLGEGNRGQGELF
jgi:protein-tyrosine phosphatase